MKNSSGKHFKIVATAILLGATIILSHPQSNTVQAGGIPNPVDVGNAIANFFSKTEQHVQTTQQNVQTTKETLLDKLAFHAAQQTLKKSVNSILNWANTGRTPFGDPIYPTNVEQMLEEQYKKNIVRKIERFYKSAQAEYSKEVAKNLAKTYLLSFTRDNSYTLPEVYGEETLRKYENGDFTEGGWSLLLSETLGLNNYRDAFQELVRDIEESSRKNEKKMWDEINRNKGFLDIKECPESARIYATNTYVDPETGETVEEPDLKNYECINYSTTTPGSIAQELVVKATGTNLENLQKIDEIGEVAIVELIRLVDGLTKIGLNKLSFEATNIINDAFSSGGSDPIQDLQSLSENQAPGTLIIDNSTIVNFTGEVFGTDPEYDDEGNIVYPGSPGAIEVLKEQVDTLAKASGLLSKIPKQVKALDNCLPGPDSFIIDRINKDFERRVRKLRRKTSKNNPDDKYIEKLASVTAGKAEFISTMMTNEILLSFNEGLSIPSQSKIRNLVASSNSLIVEKQSMADEIKKKSELLYNLQVLAEKWQQPNLSGIEKAKILKTYKTLQPMIPKGDDIDRPRILYESIENKLKQLNELSLQCLSERQEIWGENNIAFSFMFEDFDFNTAGINYIKDQISNGNLSYEDLQNEIENFSSSDLKERIYEDIDIPEEAEGFANSVINQVYSGNTTYDNYETEIPQNAEYIELMKEIALKAISLMEIINSLKNAPTEDAFLNNLEALENGGILPPGIQYAGIMPFVTNALFSEMTANKIEELIKDDPELYNYCYKLRNGSDEVQSYFTTEHKYEAPSCLDFYFSNVYDYYGEVVPTF